MYTVACNRVRIAQDLVHSHHRTLCILHSMDVCVNAGHQDIYVKAQTDLQYVQASISVVLTIHDLGYSKVHEGGDSCDGLILCQVEGAHGEVSSAVIGCGEGHV